MSNDIGAEALAAAPDLQGTLLVYAEVDEGAIAASLFYEKGGRRTVTFRDCPEALEDLLYALWLAWRATPGQARRLGPSSTMWCATAASTSP